MITTPEKKTEHQFKLLSFTVGWSLQRAEVGHFRKAPKSRTVPQIYDVRIRSNGDTSYRN